MKQLFYLLKRFLPGYRRYVVANLFLNLFSTIFNLFSFASIIPILQILFGISESRHKIIPFSNVTDLDSLLTIGKNNIYAYIEDLIAVHGPNGALFLLAIYLIVMTFLKTGTTFLASASLVPIRTGTIRDLRNKCYNKITTLPIGYFSQEKKGDIISRMTADITEVETSIISSLEMIFKNPIMIIIYLGVLFSMSWHLTLFALILLPISGILIGRIGKSLKKGSRKGQEHTGVLLALIEETLGGLRVIKAFNAEEYQRTKFHSTNERIRKIFNKLHFRYQLAHPISEFLGTVVIAVLLWYGGLLILGNNSVLSAPEFIYYLVIFYSIINPFKDLSKAMYSVQKGAAPLERIDEILNADDKIKEVENPEKIEGFEHNITFDNVCFSYKNGVEVLKNINLTIPKGHTIALVGQSGAGKSTMADLIPRFWDVTKGDILIDGVNIKQLSLKSLRSLIGYVNQEAILFNDTIYNNIAFGSETTPEQVETAAKIANAHDFISAMEEGYQSNIGDRGCLLSGGQRQRVSIARAVLKNPPILILDEATSALDTESEQLVQNAIEHLMQTRTAIVIAHRLSTIKNADLIVVLKDGEIVETGTHTELIALNGQYKKLYDMQNF